MPTACELPTTTTPDAPALRAATLWHVFWRSLFIQAAFNPREMQALGFAYALYPGLRKLYRDPDQLEAAVQRHLSCFNCHPYAAAAIVGGALHHEERVARGQATPQAVEHFKLSLMGPLAALGDGFFWLSLRPALGALGALIGLTFGVWGALVYVAGYNAVHLGLRARFLFAGYRLGDGVVGTIAEAHLPRHGERLRMLAAGCAAAVAALAATAVPTELPGGRLTWMPAAWAVFAASFWLVGRGVSTYGVVYGMAALALITGLVF